MKFRPNPRLTRQIQDGPEARDAMRQAAEQVAEHAERFAKQAGAPWMPRKGAADLFEVDETGDGARVVATDHAAHLQEYGSVRNAPNAPLRRAVRAAGLRLNET